MLKLPVAALAVTASLAFAGTAQAAPAPDPITGDWNYPNQTEGAARWQPFVDLAVKWYAGRGFNCDAVQVFTAPDLSDATDPKGVVGRGQTCLVFNHTTQQVDRLAYGRVWIEQRYAETANDWSLCLVALHEVAHAVGFDHPTIAAQEPEHREACEPWAFSARPATVTAPLKADQPERVTRKRVQPKRCKRPEWRKRHRKTCRRGILVIRSR